MQRFVMACALVVAAATASAQTVERVIDLGGLGWGRLEVPTGIDTDGNPQTVEWLIQSLDTYQYRVVAERNGAICAGPWFAAGTSLFQAVRLEKVGPTHKLLVTTMGAATVTQIALLTPACS
jgi:hypothetical protein